MVPGCFPSHARIVIPATERGKSDWDDIAPAPGAPPTVQPKPPSPADSGKKLRSQLLGNEASDTVFQQDRIEVEK
jgi:hypothetical protein